jgi:ankyrin repeat protein
MTGLHWAAKRGHYYICEFLIKSNSHVDSLDILGRTPLLLSTCS